MIVGIRIGVGRVIETERALAKAIAILVVIAIEIISRQEWEWQRAGFTRTISHS